MRVGCPRWYNGTNTQSISDPGWQKSRANQNKTAISSLYKCVHHARRPRMSNNLIECLSGRILDFRKSEKNTHRWNLPSARNLCTVRVLRTDEKSVKKNYETNAWIGSAYKPCMALASRPPELVKSNKLKKQRFPDVPFSMHSWNQIAGNSPF